MKKEMTLEEAKAQLQAAISGHNAKYWAFTEAITTILDAIKQEQPAPMSSFYMEGIEAAANWIDQQRESFDGEHGSRDNDTGSFEFGNEAQADYSNTLTELAEGIRALMQSGFRTHAAPVVSVTDEKATFEKFMKEKFGDLVDRRVAKNGDGDYFALDMQVAHAAWMARAALSTPEPVSKPYKLPEEAMPENIQDLSGVLIPRNGGWHKMDESERAIAVDSWNACRSAMLQLFGNFEQLNSPVIPDGWKLVPIEPTESMIVDGFESWPDESFSKPEEWEKFQCMSGCKQSAHLAHICYKAMLTAAPQPPVSDGWIKCSDRLPDPDIYVQASNGVWVGIGRYSDSEYLESDEHWQDEHGEFIDLIHFPVTHWMPLPNPPAPEA